MSSLLEDLAIRQDNFIIVGDFNIHVDNLENPEAVQFVNLLNDCNCIQHVNQPTHMAGHILDLIITKSYCELLDPKDILIGSFISDHAAVHFCCRLAEPSHNTCDKKFRKLRSVDIPSFLDDIETSLNQQDLGNETDANHLANCYDTTVKCTLDKHAPMKTVRVPDREPVPWYTNDLRQQKQQARRAERRWRKSGLTVDRKEFTNQRNIFTHMASLAKKDHIKKKVEDCDGDQKLLFRLVNELLGRSNQPSYLPIMTTVEQISRTDLVTSFKRRYQTSAMCCPTSLQLEQLMKIPILIHVLGWFSISCLQSKFPKSSRLHPASRVPLTLSLRGW